ncbi:MAG: DEAD/DEAH box helicase [Promethearchaeota archaeon]
MTGTLEDLGIHPSIVARLEQLGFQDLYPPQEEAIRKGITGRNLVVAVPTASGKTLVAEVLAIQRLLTSGWTSGAPNGKVVYLCPLKALASEKYDEFREHWGELGFNVDISTGDLDRVDRKLENTDILILTNEKADSLLRARAPWIGDVRVVVSDEVHLLNDASRGVTLEIVLSRFKEIIPELQLIGLSATIGNAEEVAGWLGAELVVSDWRPVELKEGVYYKRRVDFSDGTHADIPPIAGGNPTNDIVLDTIKRGGQTLVFAPTRRSSKGTAKKLKMAVRGELSKEELGVLDKIASKIDPKGQKNHVKKGANPEICELAGCIRCGVSFHHAGLTMEQRHLVEEGFRNGHIKVIAATPTLAAGINAPARRVVIQSPRRYEVDLGRSVFIPVIEYKQMAGRAGRPRYDPHGEAILLAKDFRTARRLAERYVESDPEPIKSKLGFPGVLRKHVLGSIVAGYDTTRESLYEFFAHTFFGYQNHLQGSAKGSSEELEEGLLATGAKRKEGWKLVSRFDIGDERLREKFESSSARHGGWKRETPMETLEEKIGKVLDYLEKGGFISKEGDTYQAEKLGILTSRLYLEPESSLIMLEGLREIKKRANLGDIKVTSLTFLQLVGSTPDCPTPFVSGKEFDPLFAQLATRKDELLKGTIAVGDKTSDVENLAPFKFALVLERWIKEASELDIERDHGVFPGDLHRYVDTCRWLVYCLRRFLDLSPIPNAGAFLRRLETRVNYGIRAELVELVAIRGIGRVRARLLFKNGYHTLEELKQTEPEQLNSIPGFGPTLIRQIYEQLGERVEMSDLSRISDEEDVSEAGMGDGGGREDESRGGEAATGGQKTLDSFRKRKGK